MELRSNIATQVRRYNQLTMSDNKFDFSFAKLISGQSQFLAASSPNAPEFKAVQLLDLLQFVVHWRDLIQINEKSLLIEDDQKAAELKQKLIAAGFNVQPIFPPKER
jgi:hypothetical protein